eukprot:gene9039-10339_t
MSRIRANTDFRRRTTQITARRPTYSPPPPPSETANTLTQTQVTLQKDDFIEISKPAIEVSCPEKPLFQETAQLETSSTPFWNAFKQQAHTSVVIRNGRIAATASDSLWELALEERLLLLRAVAMGALTQDTALEIGNKMVSARRERSIDQLDDLVALVNEKLSTCDYRQHQTATTAERGVPSQDEEGSSILASHLDMLDDVQRRAVMISVSSGRLALSEALRLVEEFLRVELNKVSQPQEQLDTDDKQESENNSNHDAHVWINKEREEKEASSHNFQGVDVKPNDVTDDDRSDCEQSLPSFQNANFCNHGAAKSSGSMKSTHSDKECLQSNHTVSQTKKICNEMQDSVEQKEVNSNKKLSFDGTFIDPELQQDKVNGNGEESIHADIKNHSSMISITEELPKCTDHYLEGGTHETPIVIETSPRLQMVTPRKRSDSDISDYVDFDGVSPITDANSNSALDASWQLQSQALSLSTSQEEFRNDTSTEKSLDTSFGYSEDTIIEQRESRDQNVKRIRRVMRAARKTTRDIFRWRHRADREEAENIDHMICTRTERQAGADKDLEGEQNPVCIDALESPVHTCSTRPSLENDEEQYIDREDSSSQLLPGRDNRISLFEQNSSPAFNRDLFDEAIHRLDDIQRMAIMRAVSEGSMTQDEALDLMSAYVSVEFMSTTDTS